MRIEVRAPREIADIGKGLRAACGYEPVPHARAVRSFLAVTDCGPVCRVPLERAPVVDFSGAAPADIVTRVLTDVREFAAGAKQSDDITVLAAQYAPEQG